ncbi:MAG TPA: class I SAM-dependent methyltransferase [Candidatus Binatia bacterium]|nr:class I SAM-dependent methyltransferase [Candidatus Binatia bacterium]
MNRTAPAACDAGRQPVLESCPLCGSQSAAIVAEHEALWVRCDCGLVYKRAGGQGSGGATEDPGSLGHGYDADYFRTYARRRNRRIRKSRTQILDALEHVDAVRLLDVGCSLGYTLEAARALGLEAAGVDVSEHALTHCRALGFEARRGTLEQLPFAEAAFDVAILKHVFEHTAAPRAALAELRRVLRPGGAAFFAVPNAGYFQVARGRSRFFSGEGGAAHFVCYSPDTLKRMLREEGFDPAALHPCLLHRSAGAPARRLLEAVALPVRWPASRIRTVWALRKEFWLVAVRR